MKEKNIVNALFCLPCLFAFVMIIIIPFGFGVCYSMTDWNGVRATVKFVGFTHFKTIFTAPDFMYSFLITVLYTVINLVLVNVVSFILALFVTSNIRFKNFYRIGFFIPYLIGGIVLGYIWQFIFNNAVVAFGNAFAIDFLQSSLLSRPATVIWTMSAVNVWQYSGYIMLIFIAAIQSIPGSLLEAAQIDGANYMRRIFHIIIPMMANAFTISLFLTSSFKQFDMNFTLTSGGPATRFLGTPIKASQLLAMNIFDTATANRMAEAQAKAVILFAVLAVISAIQVSVNKRKEVEM